MDDFWAHKDAVNRWNNGLPPPRPTPAPDRIRTDVATPSPPRWAARSRANKSRQIGVRLTDADFGLLEELARAHAVPVGTMARMLVVRGVRAAADAAD